MFRLSPSVVRQFEAEVNNGGLHQYYFNSSSNSAIETPEALDTIGASHTAEIVRKANSIFPQGPPRDCDARHVSLDAIAATAFEELDRRFLAELH
jgi:hypothetical protein